MDDINDWNMARKRNTYLKKKKTKLRVSEL